MEAQHDSPQEQLEEDPLEFVEEPDEGGPLDDDEGQCIDPDCEGASTYHDHPKSDTPPIGWLVSRDELTAFAKMSKNEHRFDGLQITATRTEFTNGHYLVRLDGERPDATDYPTPPEPFKPCNGSTRITGDDAAFMAKVLPKKTHIEALKHAIVGSNLLACTDLAGWTTRRVMDQGSGWPNTDGVFPHGEPIAEVTLSARYLMELSEVALALGANSLTMNIIDPDSPVRMTADAEDGRKLTILLMPMHYDGIRTEGLVKLSPRSAAIVIAALKTWQPTMEDPLHADECEIDSLCDRITEKCNPE